ncbi:sulfatase [Haloferula chungangensis]|uniref:Sulfatase n=1 Tax=Haloferula chungangensis TaxID=1048331 RepID=A0ABW2LC34_9BACT
MSPFRSLPFLAIAFALSVLKAEASKPNIIFILADDLGVQDVGFMGSKYFETPVLDELAEDSLVFENAFMYPTCSPSRAAILTGQQSFRTGCYTVPVLEKGNAEDNIFSRWTVGTEHPVYSQPLREAGYKQIHLGKWHIVGPHPDQESATEFPLQKALKQPANGDLSWLPAHRSPEIQKYYPNGRGFDENIGGTWWGDPSRGYQKGYNAPGGGYVAPFKNPFIEEKENDEWLTDRLTSDAIDFIDRHKNGPFFVNLHYYAPHMPSVPRSEGSMRHFMTKPADSSTGQGQAKGKSRESIAAYATMVKSIDDNLRRLLDYLDQAALRENTVIIFSSDNGFNGRQSVNGNLRGAKGHIYDGGLRVPALINWPGVVKARRDETPIHGLDLFPTFLDLAGMDDYQGPLDGNSLLPLMKGQPFADRYLYWQISSTYKNPPCSIIRKNQWKLIQFLKDGSTELYNTDQDPKESKDLSKHQPEMAQELLKQLESWRKENKVPLPPSSPLNH